MFLCSCEYPQLYHEYSFTGPDSHFCVQNFLPADASLPFFLKLLDVFCLLPHLLPWLKFCLHHSYNDASSASAPMAIIEVLLQQLYACYRHFYLNSRKMESLTASFIPFRTKAIFKHQPPVTDLLQDATPCGAALWALDDHFNHLLNVVAKHCKLYSFLRMPHEPIDHYIAALHELSTTCEFASLTDEMIRDQIVMKTTSSKIHEQLLMIKGLSVEKTIETAWRVQSTIHC